MNKIKLVVVILICILLLPFIVNAKECNQNSIKIETITLEDTRGNIEEVSAPSNDDGKIHLDLKMNVVGDSAEYKIVLKNTSDEEYYFDEKSLNLDTSYVDYEVQYEDGSNLIKSGEDKIITLKVVYKNKVASSNLVNGLYSDNHVLKLYLSDKSIIDDIIENPITSRNYIFIIIIGLIIGFILINKKYRKSSYLLLVFLIIPFTVKALCRCTLEIETNLVIDGKEAIFLPGREVNVKMKHLAGDDTSSVTDEYTFLNETITSIKYSDVEPSELNKEEKNVVSTSDSSYPIYMWYEDGTIYWWSEDKTPALNEDASYMFGYNLNLSNIVGVEKFDLTYTNSLFLTFCYSDLRTLDNLNKWDVSNVNNMQSLFACNIFLESIDGIKFWNVSNVKNMSYLFENCYSLEEVDLSNWSTPSITRLNNMFGMWNEDGSVYIDSKLRKIILSEKFKTSNVTNMYGLLANNTHIEDYSFLHYLDTSKVKNASHMFLYNLNLKNLNELKNFDTSNVENMHQMFSHCKNLEDISGIKDWNVSNVLNFSGLFNENSSLLDTSVINDWNITSGNNFENMFFNVPTHPDFSMLSGYWNSGGTFIPS